MALWKHTGLERVIRVALNGSGKKAEPKFWVHQSLGLRKKRHQQAQKRAASEVGRQGKRKKGYNPGSRFLVALSRPGPFMDHI